MISNKTFEVINLNLSENKPFVKTFEKTIDEISANPKDTLWKNYSNLKKNYCKYDTFDVLISESARDKIIAFAATQSNFFPAGHLRLLSRSFVHSNFRSENRMPTHSSRTSFLSNYILPQQLKWAMENNYKGVFVSFQNYKLRKFANRWAETMSQKSDLFGLQWKVLEGVYQTCSDFKSPSCWQIIVWAALKPGYSCELNFRAEDTITEEPN